MEGLCGNMWGYVNINGGVMWEYVGICEYKWRGYVGICGDVGI